MVTHISNPPLPRRLSRLMPASGPPSTPSLKASSPSSSMATPPPSPPESPVSPSPPPASPPSTPPATAPPPSSPPRSPPPNPPASSPPPSPSPPDKSPPPSPTPPDKSPPPSPSPPVKSPPPSPTSPTWSPPPPNLPSSSPPQPPPRSPPPQSSSPPSPPTDSPPPSVFSPPPPLSPLPSNPSTNSSSSPPAPGFPPPLPISPPLPSNVLIPPPGNQNSNDASPNTPSRNGGISTGGVVGIAIAFVGLAMVIGAVWCVRKRKKKLAGSNGSPVLPTSMGTSPAPGLQKMRKSATRTGNQPGYSFLGTPREPNGIGNSRPLFTYEELVKATNRFQNLLGSGGFGSVYKGCLTNGTEVAVKELKIGGGQGEREFRAEVDIISRIHHRYLVSLVGYCISENKRLLVYEYVPNDTLHFHLHGSQLVLDWAARVKIAAGAARGIAYLHEDCHPRIIHRDIKSSNILLDKNFEARVADFGLAKLAGDAHTHITTRVMGTFGYMAPEYATTGKLTEKSDVFSFGVVLLELITGRKPVDASQPLGEESLVEWARPLLSHALETKDFKELIDPRLGTSFVASEMLHMIEAAAACVRHSAMKRPRMGQIVRNFARMENDDLTNGMRVGESELFNPAQRSEEIRFLQRMAFGSLEYNTDSFSQGSYSNDR